MRLTNASLLLPLVLASGCGTAAQLTIHETTGPAPTLTTPKESLLPTINVVSAKPWPDDAAPVAATGTTVMAFARDLDHPRWLHVLPNGDVLVAETNAPERPEHGKGVKGWFFNRYQKKAGGAVPSANRITLITSSIEASLRSGSTTAGSGQRWRPFTRLLAGREGRQTKYGRPGRRKAISGFPCRSVSRPFAML